MNEEVFALQEKEREQYLNKILEDGSAKKLIVAGPGTGKTYTFSELLKKTPEEQNLALTFINKLVEDMVKQLSSCADAKTFHKFCIGHLHKNKGGFEVVRYLEDIIKTDARLMGKSYTDFKAKFQLLEEDSDEIAFYLARSDYYSAFSFDDSVYRLYQIIKSDSSVLPELDQVVVDEFQDFNPLEVALIDELAKQARILIVGDDDQAVYSNLRKSSPEHLRNKYHSGEYKIFELPYCSRCPQVIVKAINEFITASQESGFLKDRIARQFIPFFKNKQQENMLYPKIIKAQLSMRHAISKYLKSEIRKIEEKSDEIAESHEEGEEYPTVLIVGEKQYLRAIKKDLIDLYPQLKYEPPAETDHVCDGYFHLLKNINSNLGWRIIAEIFLGSRQLRTIIRNTLNGESIQDLLDKEFVDSQKKVLEIIKSLISGEGMTSENEKYLQEVLSDKYETVQKHFTGEEAAKEEVDKTIPSILLTSFEGCKGLSGGHVFIVGANNGSIPKIRDDMFEEVECCKFIVALTRTKKCCHILSNKWFDRAKKDGEWIEPLKESTFTSWLPSRLIENRGYLKSENIN